uniref:Ammonium transporter n=1 Tax=Anthurium amnicola TaxID=1678845 RepID=A0A1D1XJ22_9ARAE
MELAELQITEASPEWLSRGDNGWQLTAAAMVGLQSVPGLIILYGSIVKKKWAVNSAFMALYAFAAVLLCWVLWGHRMAFGSGHAVVVDAPGLALTRGFLLRQSPNMWLPVATYTFFQFAFAAITVVLLAGSLLGRMNFYAWMLFVPLWLTFSYTIGACTIWGNGFLDNLAVVDFSGGYVIHLASGVAGFTAAYWVGPRMAQDRQSFPPNNIVNMLGGAGLLWLGWTGFNGGAPCSANLIASLAVLNTHLCTATSILVWVSLDMIVYKKTSVIGAVQGMITGLVCITPAAGVVQSWAALVMGLASGSLPWYTMMVLHKRTAFFQRVDDPLGVFHTHAVAGTLGGLLAGFFAHPSLMGMFYVGKPQEHHAGMLYSFQRGESLKGISQMGVQLLAAAFVAGWNVVVTSIICVAISRVVALRMDEEDLKVGDDAAHGEEAYAIWADGERSRAFGRWNRNAGYPASCPM